MLRAFLFGCLILAAGVAGGEARADTIQLAPGAVLSVVFAVPGFNSTNPYPTSIGLELAGSAPSGSAVAAIPGSTEDYYSQIMLSGSLISMDGTSSISLFDADSWRLGLPTGDLTADATGSGTAMVTANANVGSAQARSIFGNTGQADFVIKNIGTDAFTIGLGPASSLANAILVPLSSNNGAVQTAGYIEREAVTQPSVERTSYVTGAGVPEPAAFAIAATGGALLFWLRRRIKP